jgi:hypothetical protein
MPRFLDLDDLEITIAITDDADGDRVFGRATALQVDQGQGEMIQIAEDRARLVRERRNIKRV